MTSCVISDTYFLHNCSYRTAQRVPMYANIYTLEISIKIFMFAPCVNRIKMRISLLCGRAVHRTPTQQADMPP
jgi:hypothetical protein